MSARIEYAPGEAWCVAAGRVVLVCERDLPGVRARALHDAAAVADSVEGLRAVLDVEPAALIGLIDLPEGRTLLRRHGVPATADDAPLPDRFGPEWAADALGAAATVAAGGLDALADDALPLEGGVVRVAAVRVAPRPSAAPRDREAMPPDAAPAPDAHEQHRGSFGETLPTRSIAEAQQPVLPASPPVDAGTPEPMRATPPVAQQATPPAPEEPGDTGNPIGGLIDSVPGFIRPAVDVRSIAPSTQTGSTTAAVPRPSAPTAPSAPPRSSAPAGDHDGMTITADEARRLQAERAAGPREPAPATGPLVLSTLCPRGHVNAPGTAVCAQCGARVDEGSAAQRRRPEVAVAVLPSGERIPLGRGVVVGRRPRSRRVEDGRVPRLVTVDSPGEDVSRSHLELRVEDWNLVAIDLSSTNGTLLLREDAAPQRLRPEASTILQLGDRLDLGDGVVLTIAPVEPEGEGTP